MKKSIKILSTLTILAFLTYSFTGILDGKFNIDTEKSNLTWKGYKVTGSHVGTIKLESGSLTFKDDILVDGEFTINMTTITNTDLKGEYKGKLERHLKSDDFFGVKKYPTANLNFNKVTVTGKNSYKVSADLTIKGKTNPITFDLSIYGRKATANLKIDRSKFDVKYGSTSFFEGLKDKVIYDEFDFITDLEF